MGGRHHSLIKAALSLRMFRPLRALAGLSGIFLLSSCDVLQLGVMNYAGPVAETQWHLYVVVGVVLLFVAGPVLILTPIIAWHYRLSNRKHAFRPKWDFSWTLEALIWIPPTAIVIGLAFVLWHYTQLLDPYRPLPSKEPPVEIQAVSFDWKWLFIYPDQHIAVMNELAVPVGRAVHVDLTSGTVMQSLMVPQLAGQIYAMAGMRTQLNFAASRTGVFHGENTQYNGSGFQNQKFNVIAMPPAQYRSWLAKVRASAHPMDGAAYKQLFQKSSPDRPIYYSTVPDRLFARIMEQATEPKR